MPFAFIIIVFKMQLTLMDIEYFFSQIQYKGRQILDFYIRSEETKEFKGTKKTLIRNVSLDLAGALVMQRHYVTYLF